MTILFTINKRLIITQNDSIYKFETGNNIKILFPTYIDDTDISQLECIPILSLPDGKTVLYKIYNFNKELYKNHLKITIPITTTLTKNAGVINLWVVLRKKNELDDTKADIIIQSSSTSFNILDNGAICNLTETNFDEIWNHTSLDSINEKLNKIENDKADSIEINNGIIELKSQNKIISSIALPDDVIWEDLE